MPQYLITGATGGLGAAILDTLLSSGIPPATITASSTRVEVASKFTSLGVNFLHIDFNDAESLRTAFTGVENLFFVSTNTFNVQRRLQQHANVVLAAKAAVVKHVWYSSLAFGAYGSDSKVDVQQAHLKTEKLLQDTLQGSRTQWTSVREGVYADAFPLFLGWYPTNPKQELYLPDDGGKGVAWAARAELGEATARLMIKGGRENQIARKSPLSSTSTARTNMLKVLLTGPHSQTYEDLVSVINETTGRQVTIQRVSSLEYIRLNTLNDEGRKPEVC